MDRNELGNRFTYHPPRSQERIDAHQSVCHGCEELAARLDDLLPDGREKESAMTKIEEVMFWANASLARQP